VDINKVPRDWEVESFDQSFARITKNAQSAKTNKYMDYGLIPVIDQGKHQIAGFIDDERKRYKCPKSGLIVFGDHTRVVKFVNHDFVLGADGTQLLEARDGFNAKFLYYLLSAKEIPNTGYNRHFKFLKELTFVKPSKSEQRAIAEVLSDIDELIYKSKLLIDKKQRILDAQCEEVFNPSKLANFENYKSQKLGTLSDITTGRRDVNEGTVNGRYPFFTCSTKHFWSDNFSFDTEAILIAGNGDVGNLHYYNGKFEAYQRTYVCTNFQSNSRYIWFFLKYALAENLGLNKIGSTIPYIVLSQLTEFEVLIPEDESEIELIVNTLEVATREIELLSNELAKYEWLKQGMMNDLLMGKVRLV